jgi:hypothetical protein
MGEFVIGHNGAKTKNFHTLKRIKNPKVCGFASAGQKVHASAGIAVNIDDAWGVV